MLGCELDPLRMEEAVKRCERLIADDHDAQYLAVNASKIVSLHHDRELSRFAAGCELVTADGQAVVWASRLLGHPVPERVAGIDLMSKLLELAERRGFGVYILGARQEVLERAVEKIAEEHPSLQIVGYRNGYFDPADERAVAAEIAAAAPQILFVAMSSPRKEQFLADNRDLLHVPFAMGVGGSVDVIAGETRRAPRVVQVLGLEWLFRMLQEPRRLLGRYLTTNAEFIVLLVRALGARLLHRRPVARHG